MRFLVEIEVRLPASLPAAEAERLRAAELERGRELRRSGAIEGIWRIPGTQRNVGVWSAADATELDELLGSLPLFAHLAIEVTPLAVHPVDRPEDG